jgi:hypothetical protein
MQLKKLSDVGVHPAKRKVSFRNKSSAWWGDRRERCSMDALNAAKVLGNFCAQGFIVGIGFQRFV